MLQFSHICLIIISGWLVVPCTVHIRRDASVMSTTDLYMHVQPTLERPFYFL